MPTPTDILIVIHKINQSPAVREILSFAKRQADYGHHVTIFTHEPGTESGPWTMLSPVEKERVKSDANPALVRSYDVYHWLKTQRFDKVFFEAQDGIGYYSLLARMQGLALHETRCELIGEHVTTDRPSYAGLEIAFMVERCRELITREAKTVGGPLPLVTVCLTHYNRPALLQRAVDSIERQDYANLELIVVDDGSTDADTPACLDLLERGFSRRGWRILRQPNRYLGAARNAAAKAARGEYLMFMDDDNIAQPQEVSTFVTAARASGADILTSVMQRFDGEPERLGGMHLPLGGCLSAAIFENCYGDANALVKRSVFEAIGGFTEEVGLGLEDMEFFTAAILKGFRLEVVPEPLFLYRDSPQSMVHSTSREKNGLRALRPLQAKFPEIRNGLVTAQHYYLDAQALIRGLQDTEVLYNKSAKSWEETLNIHKRNYDEVVEKYHALTVKSAEQQAKIDALGDDTVRLIQVLNARPWTRKLLQWKVAAFFKLRELYMIWKGKA